MESRLHFNITPQPDDTTCGPSCLHAVYRYYGDEIPMDQVLGEVTMMPTGGTLAVHLGCHALERGYRATLYTYNLMVFDPTWFLPGIDIRAKLEQQAAAKTEDARLQAATPAYRRFLELGGRIRFEDLTTALIRSYLNRATPIISGLSSTYLYKAARECGDYVVTDDDVRGVPSGHFVVLCGYGREERSVLVADPYMRNPVSGEKKYIVAINRVLNAVLLGVITYDANLLIVRPANSK